MVKGISHLLLRGSGIPDTFGVLKYKVMYNAGGNHGKISLIFQDLPISSWNQSKNKTFSYDNLSRIITFNGPWGTGRKRDKKGTDLFLMNLSSAVNHCNVAN
jgi:hypothetical protein